MTGVASNGSDGGGVSAATIAVSLKNETTAAFVGGELGGTQ
jgi:hypothetical protein